MQVLEKLAEFRYEQLVFCHDKATGLRAIITAHDTTLGPALGGCRVYPYTSEDDAIVDVLRLARGMTYKAAASGLNLGGGKSPPSGRWSACTPGTPTVSGSGVGRPSKAASGSSPGPGLHQPGHDHPRGDEKQR